METHIFPLEILSDIFLYALPSFPDQVLSLHSAPLVLTQVSREWRALARCIPELWAQIRLPDTEGWSDAALTSLFAELGTWLRLSRSSPLSIHLATHDPRGYTRYLNVLSVHSRRWKDVHMELAPGHYLPPISLLAVPLLERFTLKAKLSAENAEALKESLRFAPSLHAIDVEWHPGWSLPRPNMTQLSMHADESLPIFDLAQLTAHLSQCNVLSSLKLAAIDYDDFVGTVLMAELPQLQVLDAALEDPVVLGSFLRAIAAPQLHTLRLCTRDAVELFSSGILHIGLREMLSRCSHTLHVFELTSRRVSDGLLIEALRNMPNLSYLSLKSMPLSRATFEALTPRWTHEGKLTSGLCTKLEHLHLRTDDHTPNFPYEQLASLVESRWRVAPNPFHANTPGAPVVARLTSLEMADHDVCRMELDAPAEYARIVRCRDEGLRWIVNRQDVSWCWE